MSNNISQLQICAQRDLDSTIKELKLLNTQDSNYQKLRASLYTSKEWPQKSNIDIYFMNDPPSNIQIKRYTLDYIDENGNKVKWDPLQIEIIQNYNNFRISDIIPYIKRVLLERIQPIVNLKFNFVDNPFAPIRINFNTNVGSWSYLGTDALTIPYNEATMNFGWFNIATVLHEFGHMLGMIHEHQSPFGRPIPWNITAVYDWASRTQGWNKEETNEQVINKYNWTLLNGTIFDPKSIMLYFYPRELTRNNTGTSMNVRLSPYDVIYINSRYPGSLQTPSEFYKNVYGEDIYGIDWITKVDIDNVPNKITKNQNEKGTILTTFDFEGKIKTIYITVSAKSIIYILNNSNNIIFNAILDIGENILKTNISISNYFKATIKIIDNIEINISKLSFDIENYISVSPPIPVQNNLNIYILYGIGIVSLITFIIILIQRNFKIF